MKWIGDESQCGRFSLQRARIRHGGETDTEWRVVLVSAGRVVACAGTKSDAKLAAAQVADDIQAGRPVMYWD